MRHSTKILFVFLLILFGVVYWQYPRLNIISGYAAKNMCSCMFEALRTEASVIEEDNNFSPINIAEYEIDTVNQTVTASVFGYMKRTAMYREDLGCQVLVDDEKLARYAEVFPVPHNCPPPAPYPYGELPQADTIFANVNYDKLQNAIRNVFDPEGKDSLKTRSLMIVYKDQIIGEKYAEGYDEASIFLGWSMSKSILVTLFGRLEKQGKLSLDDSHLFPEWENDQRANISLRDLLQMQSGLEWEENYNEISDVTRMLFLEKDMSRIPKEKQPEFEPGTHWKYSSGTTNLLSNYLRNHFDNYQDYLNYPVVELSDKLGLRSLFVELDIDGNYVYSSYGWANTGHWAKLGLLYLHRGNWDGEQLINESFVDFVSTPNAHSNGRYGAHFWLNSSGYRPDVPKDMYAMEGYQGQMVFIIPSKDLVVVRMGLTEEPIIDFNKMLKEIIEAVE